MSVIIGQNVDGWCTRCKIMTRHAIDTMVGEKITRSHCNTCGGRHAHRAQPPKTRPGGRPEMSLESKHAALLRGRTEAAARPYSSTARFNVGEVVAHETFGLGVVTGARDNIKIDIVFANGPKVLQQGC